MSAWLAASVAFKLCIYLAVAAAIGGCFTVILAGACRPRPSEWSMPGFRGTLALCVVGLLASSTYFFVRVGDFSGSGLAGMFDPLVARINWESPVGEALRFRLLGFTLLIAVMATYRLLPLGWMTWQYWLAAFVYLAAAFMLAVTFSFTGHSVELGIAGTVAITVHVMAALWWAGALYPLWRATDSLEPIALQNLLHQFGVIAAGSLFLMVLAGGVLLYLLLIAPVESVSPVYAVTITAKLLLVAGLFLIAALHKWRAVPRLLAPAGRVSFRRSLFLEVVLMFAVLVLTATFSTVLGPYHSA